MARKKRKPKVPLPERIRRKILRLVQAARRAETNRRWRASQGQMITGHYFGSEVSAKSGNRYKIALPCAACGIDTKSLTGLCTRHHRELATHVKRTVKTKKRSK
jgi:hypothetical protein